jgi:hypothetical protein
VEQGPYLSNGIVGRCIRATYFADKGNGVHLELMSGVRNGKASMVSSKPDIVPQGVWDKWMIKANQLMQGA